MTRAIVYDIEIIRGPINRNETRVPGIEYVNSWDAHAAMGVSCIGVYDYDRDIYLTFLEDTFPKFVELADSADRLIGFNSLSFDNRVIAACIDSGFADRVRDKSYDLLVEIWTAAGLGPQFVYPSHTGYGLDAVSQANGGPPKTGHGAFAPVLWQQQKYGEVILYCANDILMTRLLVDQVRRGIPLACPKTGRLLPVRSPF